MVCSKTSGIYAIVSAVNSRQYIGSSTDIPRRWSGHLSQLRKNIHHSIHLQRAWNKYGEDAFEFVVLEECPAEQLLDREQHYFDLHPDKYNCAPVAGSQLGIKRSPETLARMSAAQMGRKHSPETVAKRNATNTGRKNSLETREKMRQAALGRVISPEQRAKISSSLKGNKNATGQIISAEHRRKIGEATRGRKDSDETRAKKSAALTGHKHTLASIEKMRLKAREREARKREVSG